MLSTATDTQQKILFNRPKISLSYHTVISQPCIIEGPTLKCPSEIEYLQFLHFILFIFGALEFDIWQRYKGPTFYIPEWIYFRLK